LVGVGIQGEEGLSAFAGPGLSGGQGVESHVALAVTLEPMRVDGQEFAGEMTPGATD
jgi:hypothetical protein